MWTIFWQTLKDRRIILLVYMLSSIALLWMYIGLFPSIKEQSANLEQLVPEGMLKAFNLDIKTFTTIEGFLSVDPFSFVWPIMLIFMLVGFGGSALAGESEKGTIEILLSQPVSRFKIFLGRFFAGLMMLILFVILSVLSAIPIIKIYDIGLQVENFYTMAILGSMFGLAILSLALFLSAIFSDKGKVFFISGVILVIMYVLNILSALKESLADLKYFSFFYYYNPSKVLVYNEIDHWAYWAFLGTALILTIVGLIWFTKRDIAT